MIDNKIVNIITKASRASQQNRSDKVESEAKNIGFDIEISKERYTSPEKRQKIFDDLKDSYDNVIIQYQKIIHFSGNTPNQTIYILTKNWIEINDDSRGTYNTK